MSFKIRFAAPIAILGALFSATLILFALEYKTDFDKARGMVRAGSAVSQISNLIHEVQKERAKSVLFLSAKVPLIEIETQRKIVNNCIVNLNRSIEALRDQNASATANSLLKELADTRKSVDERKLKGSEVAKSIASQIAQWIHLQVSISNIYEIIGFSDSLQSIAIFEQAKEGMGRLRASLNVILSDDEPIGSLVVSSLSEFMTSAKVGLSSPLLSVSSDTKKALELMQKSDNWTSAVSIYLSVVEKSSTGRFGFNPAATSEKITKVIDDFHKIIESEILVNQNKIEEAAKLAQMKFVVSILCMLVTLLVIIFYSYVSVRTMSRVLLDVSTQIEHGANFVAGSVDKVAGTSSALAASSSEQAAALQETVSALEETSAMISRNSNHAESSRLKTEETKRITERGAVVISNLRESMGSIYELNSLIVKDMKKKADEISSIIGVITSIESKTKVINDIVFQTKLLSFNASVEAARAGEQGKGFSVVAEEIGNLAQVSGRSANEISEIITESSRTVKEQVSSILSLVDRISREFSSKVQDSNQIAVECEALFNQILKEIIETDTLVAEIAQASKEQARGLGEVNRAMGELNLAAQQNDSLSSETSRIAVDLREQVEQMRTATSDLNILVNGKDMTL